MRSEDLADAIGRIDDDLLQVTYASKKSNIKKRIVMFGGMSAAIIIGILLCLNYFGKGLIDRLDYENLFIFKANNRIMCIYDNIMVNIDDNSRYTKEINGVITASDNDYVYYVDDRIVNCISIFDNTRKKIYEAEQYPDNEEQNYSKGIYKVLFSTGKYLVYHMAGTMTDSTHELINSHYLYNIRNSEVKKSMKINADSTSEYKFIKINDDVVMYTTFKNEALSPETAYKADWYVLNLATDTQEYLGCFNVFGCYSNGVYYYPKDINKIGSVEIPKKFLAGNADDNKTKNVTNIENEYTIAGLGNSAVCRMCEYDETKLMLVTYGGAIPGDVNDAKSITGVKQIFLYDLLTGELKKQTEYIDGGIDDVICNAEYGVCSYSKKSDLEPGYIKFDIVP